MSLIRDVVLTRYDNGKIEETPDIVVVEYPLNIYINGSKLITLLCTPRSLDCLSLGYLLSEQIIKTKSDLKDINIDEEEGIADIWVEGNNLEKRLLKGKGTLTTGYGGGTLLYNLYKTLPDDLKENKIVVSYKKIIKSMKEFADYSEVFKSTGGVHSAALSDGKKILVFHEDVGRHNALDKVLGEAFLKDIDITDKLILISGRISSEMLTKAAKRKVAVLVSRSAPMDLALEIGKSINMTIIGFARGERFNIYSGKERISFSEKNL